MRLKIGEIPFFIPYPGGIFGFYPVPCLEFSALSHFSNSGVLPSWGFLNRSGRLLHGESHTA